MISFWEDYYKRNPIESKRTEDGEVMFETGDPYIDKWEKELAEGITPDLLEGLDQRTRQLAKLSEKDRETAEAAGVSSEGFSDDYSAKLAQVVEG